MPPVGVLPDTVRSRCLCLILSGNAVHPGPDHRRTTTAQVVRLPGLGLEPWATSPPAGPWLPPLTPYGCHGHSGYWCDDG